MNVDFKYTVRFHIKAMHLLISVSNNSLTHYIMNKLTPHGMSKINIFSPKLMLTQQTFDT